MKLNPLITCEHAGRIVPPNYTHLFKDADEVLESHRGWDPGALEIATQIHEFLRASFFKCESTRLLVEANRSLFSETLFSEFSAMLTEAEREEVLKQFYYPHRTEVEQWIANAAAPILHLSIHTFTPVFKGFTRVVEIGLLFDPERTKETEFCLAYRDALERALPDLIIQFNEPYRGIDDGFTSHLRKMFPDEKYLGIEIEVSQKFNGTPKRNEIALALAETAKALGGE